MLKGKAVYYLVLVLFSVAAAWIGYFIAQVIKSNALSKTSLIWMSLIGAAVVFGMGFVYFLTQRWHGQQDIPCNIRDTENIKVNNYHLIMATSRSKKGIGMASVRSTDMVSGIAVEPVNRDAQPHRIRIEVGVNGEFDRSAVKEMVINAGATVPVAVPFPKMLRLAYIESVDIRIRQA
jgi:hypothetical protein